MAQNREPSPFLSLPLELRNSIYSYLLSTKYTRKDTIKQIKASINSQSFGWKLTPPRRVTLEEPKDITTDQHTLTACTQQYSAATAKPTRKPPPSSTTRTSSSPSPTTTAISFSQMWDPLFCATASRNTVTKVAYPSSQRMKKRGRSTAWLWRFTSGGPKESRHEGRGGMTRRQRVG